MIFSSRNRRAIQRTIARVSKRDVNVKMLSSSGWKLKISSAISQVSRSLSVTRLANSRVRHVQNEISYNCLSIWYLRTVPQRVCDGMWLIFHSTQPFSSTRALKRSAEVQERCYVFKPSVCRCEARWSEGMERWWRMERRRILSRSCHTAEEWEGKTLLTNKFCRRHIHHIELIVRCCVCPSWWLMWWNSMEMTINFSITFF